VSERRGNPGETSRGSAPDPGIFLNRRNAEDWREGGFGIYLHWPFCQSKCPYCDFNSHVAERIDQSRWLKAYLAELDRLAAEVPGRLVNAVFFGGGTPSLMQPDVVAGVLERIRALWPQANDVEVTLEANPGSIEAGRFRAYREGGVNRVSMGMQAMRDDDLRRLGRMHTVAEARAAFDIARDCFDRVSFDLIYARQDQSLADWRAELDEALAMAVDHLSLYQLTVEEGTVFAERFKRGQLRGLPDEDKAADFYEVTQEVCGAAGMQAYEVSNHARPGAESRHNQIYWRSGDWLGIGPGAHGRLTLGDKRWTTEAPRAPGDWLARVEQGKAGELPREILSASERLDEFLIMGLRLSEGIALDRMRGLAGKGLGTDIQAELESDGVILQRDGRIATTERGRLVLNHVIRRISEGLS
jgi:putative oxygen-independent coproporphyrinogen III oxidase